MATPFSSSTPIIIYPPSQLLTSFAYAQRECKISLLEAILKKHGGSTLVFSRTKFNAKKTSDIDLYIETNSKLLKKKIEKFNSKINVKIGKFDNKSLLIKEIIKNHVIIKGVERFYEKSGFFK